MNMRAEPKRAIYFPSLNSRFVFLSASFPAVTRDERYFKTSNPLNITDAVLATARAVAWASGKLVCGGHPTISPLLLSIGGDIREIFQTHEPFVRIYQSRFYESKIPPQTLELANSHVGQICWINAGKDQPESLRWMREKMLKETKPAAGIFIGGMEGIEEEFRLFRSHYPNEPVYCIGSTGGAAKYLAEGIALGKVKVGWNYKTVDPQELLVSTVYPALMHALVEDLEAYLKRQSLN